MYYEQNISQAQADELNQQLAKLAQKVRYALNTKQYAEAERILRNEILPVVPEHPTALLDLAFCLEKQGKFEQAYHYAKNVLQSYGNDFPDPFIRLTAICYHLKRFEESLYYARKALLKRHNAALVKNPTVYPLPEYQPLGLSADKSRNIICYSLFGDQPRYCETAVINVDLAAKIYPEWTCRFYVDHSVPTEIVQRLKNKGAQVCVVPENNKISGLFWRFFAFDDPTVQCLIIRDADSYLSYKERAAVDEWLASGKWFHLMRDAHEHCELILAGMWGGYAGVFPNMQQLCERFFAQLEQQQRTMDQEFLRQVIYPTVIQSVITHDNFRLDPSSLPYPPYEISEIECLPYFHIGMIDAYMKTATFYLHQQNVKKVRWFLKDEHHQEVCSYVSNTIMKDDGCAVSVNLPYHYSEKIAEEKWYFSYQALETA